MLFTVLGVGSLDPTYELPFIEELPDHENGKG
ncbi:hypothetical protein V5J35_003650 [Endozoicomonas sp. NE40]|uniref:Uncharacterized protein n=1 Tax=Endozoicomonas lisbonensis TaxID=3120522 RepID=A0ABV2SNI0_9GAMM